MVAVAANSVTSRPASSAQKNRQVKPVQSGVYSMFCAGDGPIFVKTAAPTARTRTSEQGLGGWRGDPGK